MKQKAVIFDIDGTLANCDHRKHFIQNTPKMWNKFFQYMDEDTVNKDIRSLWEKCSDYCRIIITGRPETYRKETIKWLDNNGIALPLNRLFFRGEYDRRGDDVLKREIYINHIKDKYDVIFVVEDRSRVVKMWRSHGLTCLQCAEGDF